MSSLKKQPVLNTKPLWQTTLGEYITAIAWSPDGKTLAAATAAGEVVLYDDLAKSTDKLRILQSETNSSVDCLSFSADGRWLVAAGQDGALQLWDANSLETMACDRSSADESGKLNSNQLNFSKQWIEHLVWHPARAEFAISLGKYAQVWSAESRDIITTVNFEQSSVLALSWHPSGDWLTVGGYQGIKLWSAKDWYEDPINFELPTATGLMTWHPSGQYLASNTLDNLVVLFEWNGTQFDDSPWRMQGFPGKVRAFDWSEFGAEPAKSTSKSSEKETAMASRSSLFSSLLVSSSGSEVVVWRRHPDPEIGWSGEVLQGHVGNVSFVSFKPKSAILASAGEDGRISLWRDATNWTQTLENSKAEITSLEWQPQGHRLAAGNADGEVFIWTESTQAKGFR
jgi:WD40 repeat protein